MLQNRIDLELKKRCVAAYENGTSPLIIYRTMFLPEHDGMSLSSFRSELHKWRRQDWPDDITLVSGTYSGFRPYNATVQVNAKGEIIHSWIRQNIDDRRWEELIDAVKENAEPKFIDVPEVKAENRMLEIPLFDMHFPQNDHIETLQKLLQIIESKEWDEINLIVGQDLFHNNDLRGHTAAGTPIEKVDMVMAWNLAKNFWCQTIEESLYYARHVNLIYSMGNHDESIAWAFVEMLKERYPQLEVDDELEQRKVLFWKECFIGFTHGFLQKTKAHDLRSQFTIEYPQLFASAKVREIHAGHLHHEAEADLYGVMIRRLGRSGIDDQWTKDNGFIGAHKRFMVFEWAPGSLKAIHYL